MDGVFPLIGYIVFVYVSVQYCDYHLSVMASKQYYKIFYLNSSGT